MFSVDKRFSVYTRVLYFWVSFRKLRPFGMRLCISIYIWLISHTPTHQKKKIRCCLCLVRNPTKVRKSSTSPLFVSPNNRKSIDSRKNKSIDGVRFQQDTNTTDLLSKNLIKNQSKWAAHRCCCPHIQPPPFSASPACCTIWIRKDIYSFCEAKWRKNGWMEVTTTKDL